MSENKLVLKSVYDLLGENFYLADYQRGYRWSEINVTQLLDDVWEFSQKERSGDEFYCLQPIVVRPYTWENVSGEKLDGWEVIDGQQRLTTIRIILSYLVKEHLKRTLNEAFKKDAFTIDYETRPKSEAFLKDLQEDNSNIDFYHMWSAYQATSKWFEDKDYDDCNNFLSTLLAKKDNAGPVKVIWYEINDEVNAIDIFTRLNIGKIPLTNAELIKALFLGKANPDNQNQKANPKQLQIASEWDAIENTLQDKSFWYFIYDEDNKKLPQHKYETRIEYIFDLMKNKPLGEEKYFTFYKFLDEDFRGSKTINDIWLDIKRYFLTFEEWYQDRILYHLVGFLITAGGGIKELKASSDKKTKSDFKICLREEIGKTLNVDIENIKYNDSNVKSVLLLFNIHTLLANETSKSRFPFDSYKNDNWDIEHVRSQSEVELTGGDRIDWAKLVLEFYTGIAVAKEPESLDNHLEEIKKLLDKEEQQICRSLVTLILEGCKEDEWNELYQLVSKGFKEENFPKEHSISNLALLDAGTNRAYKNAFFPIKRMEIMKREMKGSFVPIGTKNLFMKAYSRRFDKVMYWGQTDADDYLEVLKNCLKVYAVPVQNKEEKHVE